MRSEQDADPTSTIGNTDERFVDIDCTGCQDAIAPLVRVRS